MRRFFRVLGILLLLLIVAAGLLVIFAPTESTIRRSVTIHAPQAAVFAPMSHFRQWPAWTSWAEADPTQKADFGGEDGAPGSTYHWVGEEIGEGRITAASVTASRLDYNLDFIRPFEAHNRGLVQAEGAGNSTFATMSMTMHSPRPMNALSWLFKGAVEKDFDRSLSKLKAGVESGRMAGGAM